MLCTAAVWGFNFIATRASLEVFSPVQLAFARSVLTLVILLPWWKPLERISWQLLLAALSIGTLSFFLFYKAISITESLTTVAVATQLMPALSAILALVFYRELLTARKWVGIMIATIGALYLTGVTDSSLSVMALGLTVLSVLFHSGGAVVIGKSPSVSVWRMLAWISAMSLLPLGLMTAASGPMYPDPELIQTQHWLALLFTVILSGLLGQAVLFILYRKYPVADVIPWALFIPVFAGSFAVLVYGESISLSLVIGGAIIIAGVWVQQKSEFRADS
jgi:O-acetylserine/cysteine efflux transporter